MKLTLRLVLVPCLAGCSFSGCDLGRTFYRGPLGHGRFEGTPVTVIEFFTVFPLVSIVLLTAGNRSISRFFIKQVKVAHCPEFASKA